MTDRKSNYMHLASGGKYYPFEPLAEEVHVIDIAHSLASKARWNGHTLFPVWVAQHSVYTALCDIPGHNSAQERLDRLMHDASEYVVGDLIRPLKYSPEFAEPFKKVETLNEEIISKALGLVYPHAPHIKIGDEMVTSAEYRQVVRMNDGVVFDNKLHDDSKVAPFNITEWTWRQAEYAFLNLFTFFTAMIENGLGEVDFPIPVTTDEQIFTALLIPSDEDLRSRER